MKKSKLKIRQRVMGTAVDAARVMEGLIYNQRRLETCRVLSSDLNRYNSLRESTDESFIWLRVKVFNSKLVQELINE